MADPNIKIMAISNVYVRMMHFASKGDCEYGHKHTFDHGTLVSSGAVLVEIVDEHTKETVSSKEFRAPEMIFIDKDKYHKITALEDNTVCGCIHALRTVDADIIDPDCFIEPADWTNKRTVMNHIYNKTRKPMDQIIASPPLSRY